MFAAVFGYEIILSIDERSGKDARFSILLLFIFIGPLFNRKFEISFNGFGS